MGKKRIIKQTEEELMKEGEGIEKTVQKSEIRLSDLQRGGLKANVYIQVSYNNTIITVCDKNGNVLTWASAGSIGFKGTKKSTPFAASKIAEAIAERMKKNGVEEASVFIKGIGSGRESSIRSLGNRGINIVSIKDVTPVPHNGCRPPKVRRV